MNNIYECQICLCHNHVSRFHCQNCGTIPAKYSIIGRPARFTGKGDFDKGYDMIPVVVAYGVSRQEGKRTIRRAGFKTERVA